jgi:tetratricopeptide (TPR) repeat protein
LLRAELGDAAERRCLTAGMLERYAETENLTLVYRAARFAVLFPDGNADPDSAVRLVRRAQRSRPSEFGHSMWVLVGMAHYRAGEWQAALEAFEKAAQFPDTDSSTPDRLLFSALARARLGDAKQARADYDQALRWLETNRNQYEGYLPRERELLRFRAEAAAVLDPKRPPR